MHSPLRLIVASTITVTIGLSTAACGSNGDINIFDKGPSSGSAVTTIEDVSWSSMPDQVQPQEATGSLEGALPFLNYASYPIAPTGYFTEFKTSAVAVLNPTDSKVYSILVPELPAEYSYAGDSDSAGFYTIAWEDNAVKLIIAREVEESGGLTSGDSSWLIQKVNAATAEVDSTATMAVNFEPKFFAENLIINESSNSYAVDATTGEVVTKIEGNEDTGERFVVYSATNSGRAIGLVSKSLNGQATSMAFVNFATGEIKEITKLKYIREAIATASGLAGISSNEDGSRKIMSLDAQGNILHEASIPYGSLEVRGVNGDLISFQLSSKLKGAGDYTPDTHAVMVWDAATGEVRFMKEDISIPEGTMLSTDDNFLYVFTKEDISRYNMDTGEVDNEAQITAFPTSDTPEGMVWLSTSSMDGTGESLLEDLGQFDNLRRSALHTGDHNADFPEQHSEHPISSASMFLQPK